MQLFARGHGRRGDARVGALDGSLIWPLNVPHAGRRDATGGEPTGAGAAVPPYAGGPAVRAGLRCAATRRGSGGGVLLP